MAFFEVRGVAELAMVCLRCDWQGETDDPACPSCGAAALYRVADSSPVEEPATSLPAPPPIDAAPVPPRRNWRAVVLAVVAATIVIAAVASWDADPSGSTPLAASPSAVQPSATSRPTQDANGPPRQRFLRRRVGGVTLSLVAPQTWGPSPILRAPRAKIYRQGAIGITKSFTGGQHAEAIIFWTTLPAPVHVAPCAGTLPTETSSAAALAAALSHAPGIHTMIGPYELRLGGHTAQRIVMRVRADEGCDPGYFFTWPSRCWGQCWVETSAGDEITMWIVEAAGSLVVIESETTREARTPGLDQEIRQIVDSIQLD